MYVDNFRSSFAARKAAYNDSAGQPGRRGHLPAPAAAHQAPVVPARKPETHLLVSFTRSIPQQTLSLETQAGAEGPFLDRFHHRSYLRMTSSEKMKA